MIFKVRYENGVFRPLGEFQAEEGMVGEVHLPDPESGASQPHSVMDLDFFGMWADREDIHDGVDYVNRVRRYRRQPLESSNQP